jgi:hypothetical protein
MMKKTTVWYCGDDCTFDQDGAIFDDYAEAERVADALAKQYDCSAVQLLDKLEKIEIETADASTIEDLQRCRRALTGAVTPATLAAIQKRFNETHDAD